MSALFRLGLNLLKRETNLISSRAISLYPKLQLKEIHEIKNGKELIIQGSFIASPREPFLLKTEPDKCPICSTGLEVKHTDVLILSQFVRSDGCMLPRRVTKLCRKEQKRIGAMVSMAQKAGLMPNLTPANSKKDPMKRNGWKKYNKYFDESTIKVRSYVLKDQSSP